jgi:hypothetical protein
MTPVVDAVTVSVQLIRIGNFRINYELEQPRDSSLQSMLQLSHYLMCFYQRRGTSKRPLQSNNQPFIGDKNIVHADISRMRHTQ